MRWILIVCCLLVLSGCSLADDNTPDVVTGEEPIVDPPAVVDEPTAVVDETGAGVAQGTITIDAASYVLEFRCFAPPDGTVSAIGVGEGGDGINIEAFVELDPDASYVGLRFDEADSSTWVESALDAPLDVFVEDGRIVADSVQFVKDINLETGEGTWVGAGHVDIVCDGFETSAPS